MDYIADSFPDGSEDLRELFKDPNPFLTYLTELKTQMPGGTNIVGAISARMKAYYRSAGMNHLANAATYAVGDRTVDIGGEMFPARVGLGAPIAYDIWYLFPAGNVLTFGGKSISASMEKMEEFFKSVDDAKPLKSPPDGPKTATISTEGFEYTIKLARFEVSLKGNGTQYSSVGPKEPTSYSGFIAFPVGPLGVMWKISLASDSSLTAGGNQVYPVTSKNRTVQGGALLPPFDLRADETCGELMMNKGYLISDDSTCELMAEGFGEDDPDKHKWLRYWIKEDNTTIVPGEFVAALCRPWPFHCWWKQETAPFVYAGNWVETEFYTSGIVKEVLVIKVDFTPNEKEVGNRYKVWVKNESIIVKSSDFLEYEVGERVGILKSVRSGSGGTSYGGSVTPAGSGGGTTNCTWKDLALQGTEDALNTNWVIVPVEFYGESNMNIVGG